MQEATEQEMEEELTMEEQVEDLFCELFPVATRAGKISHWRGVCLDLGVVEISYYEGHDSISVLIAGHDAPHTMHKGGNPLEQIRAFYDAMMPVARALVAAAGPGEVSNG